MNRTIWFATMFAALNLNAGCLIIDGDEGGGGGDGQGGAPAEDAPRLFVLSLNAGVASYADPARLDGRVEPSTNLASGPDTDMFGPREIAVGPAGDLYVAAENDAAVVIYANAMGADGAVLPSRKLKGAATGLDVPIGLALDADDDVLYVVNSASNGSVDKSIFAYAGASSIDGDAAPARRIEVDLPDFSPIQIAWHDGTLYAVSQGDNTSRVLVFDDATELDGVSAPTRTIENSAFGQVVTIHVDDSGLYAVDDEAQLFVYEPGSATLGATIDIAGASRLSAVTFDAEGTMYLADSSANVILSFDGGAGTQSSASPSRTFDAVGLTLPSRMVVVEP